MLLHTIERDHFERKIVWADWFRTRPLAPLFPLIVVGIVFSLNNYVPPTIFVEAGR